MTDRELLEAIYNDMQLMKAETKSLQDDMSTAKDEIETLYMDTTIIKEKVTRIELTLENETNHNIQLLAENHISIVDKLNDAIRVQDKSSLYEVQISGLKLKLEKLENEIKEIKTKIA